MFHSVVVVEISYTGSDLTLMFSFVAQSTTDVSPGRLWAVLMHLNSQWIHGSTRLLILLPSNQLLIHIALTVALA